MLLTRPGTVFRNINRWAASVALVKKCMQRFRHSDCKTIKTYNMQTAKKFLLFFLGLTSLMQFGLGAWILFSLDSLLNIMHMQFSDDLKVFSTYFGICLFIIASLGLVAISFNRSDKPEGLVLAKFIGWWMLVAGVIVLVKLGRFDLAVPDFIRGLGVLISAYLVKMDKETSLG